MRDIKKTIEQYKNITKKHKKPAFSAYDLYQLRESTTDIWECIINSLRVGYVIGYHKGRKDQKEHQRKEIKKL